MTLPASGRRAPISNAAYGIVEYISLPLLMLCSVSFLLHHLGVEQYGIWLLASAAVTGGTLLSAGFGDAAIKYISACRGSNDERGVERIIRTLFGINLSLGTVVAGCLWLLLPALAARLPHASEALRISYRHALSIGCVLLLVKAVEGVFLCTQRAYERYDIAACFTVGTRFATILSAVVIAALGRGTVPIMVTTLIVSLISLGLQMYTVWRRLALRSLLPSWNRASAKELFGFGCFSWLQGLVGLLTSQADRFVVGYLLGAQSLVYYSICVQMAMPIHGIAGAGLQILFPYLAARLGVMSIASLRRKYFFALAANVALVAVLAAPLVFGSHSILRLWLGEDFAVHAGVALSITASGFALLGLNVTGYYVLMALGRIRLLALVNVAAAVTMLAAIEALSPRFGIVGAAVGRLVYGPITWITYRALHNGLRVTRSVTGEELMVEAI